MRRKERFIALVLCLTILMTFSLSSCGKTDGNKNSADEKAVDIAEEAREEVESYRLSPENTSITTEDDITIRLGEFVLDEETTLTVTPRPVEENPEEGYKIESYDISLGDMAELDDFITIRIPYDDSYCEEGEDASRCVGGKYFNEETNQWEDVLYEVDAQTKEVVIHTDHLSSFGLFYIKNEGMRSAHIIHVIDSVSAVDSDIASDVLQEYVAAGGAEGEKAQGLGARVVSEIFDFSDSLGDGIGYLENPINIASLGNPVFDTALIGQAHEKLGTLGKVASVVKIGATVLKSDASDEELLTLYKDVAFFSLGFSKSAALGLAMSGVWIFEYTISSMFKQGMAIKMENMGAAYLHFNDSYSDGEHKARTLKEWRQKLIEIVEAHPNDEKAIMAALEKEIDSYAREFWEDETKQAGAIQEVNLGRIPYPTDAEIESLVADYKSNLYNRLYPVCASVSNYMQAKAHSEYVKALNDIKNFYNQPIEFTIREEVAVDGEVKSAGFIASFDPLSDLAIKEYWYGPLNKEGMIRTSFTILGFIQAGLPNKVAIYEPGTKPGEDKPRLMESFTLSAPSTELSFNFPENVLIYQSSEDYTGYSPCSINRAFEQISSINIQPDGSFHEELAYFEKEGWVSFEDGSEHDTVAKLSNFIISGTFDPLSSTGSATGSFTIENFVDVEGGKRTTYHTDRSELNTWVYVHSYHMKDVSHGTFTITKSGDLIKMEAKFHVDSNDVVTSEYQPVKVYYGEPPGDPQVEVYTESFDFVENYYFLYR